MIVRRGAAELGTEVAGRARRADRPPRGRRRPQRAQHPRARVADGRGRGTGRSPRRTSRMRRASGRSSTTRAATRTTTSSRPSSSRCAARTRTRRVYYLAAMLEGGEDPRFIARRMIVLASEDIGNADPRALAGRGRGRAGGRARRAPRGAAQPGAGGDLPRARAEVERRHHALGEAAKDVRELGTPARRTRSGTRITTARGSSAAARATSTRTPIRRLRRRQPAGQAEGQEVLSSRRERRGRGKRWRLRRPRARSGKAIS